MSDQVGNQNVGFLVSRLITVEVVYINSRFGFEGWVWVLIASVPDLCILFTYTYNTNNIAMMHFHIISA